MFVRLILLAALLGLSIPGAASAAELVYWTNSTESGAVRVGPLDGGGTASDVFAGEDNPTGVALDPAAGKVYWATAGSIRVGEIDGSGSPTTLYSDAGEPRGVAVDAAAGKIYWADFDSEQIRVGSLDGSAPAVTLYTGQGGQGVAVDPPAGRLYWASAPPGAIRAGSVDGTAPVATLYGANNPVGVAVDVGASRIYWADGATGAVRAGSLDGALPATTLFGGESAPDGVALDPVANRIVWANEGDDTIRTDNLGFATTVFSGEDEATFPALLRSPDAAGPPVVTGGDQAGEPLACSNGTWASDLPAAFLFRAPRSFGSGWEVDGEPIPGAHGATFTPAVSGSYSCTVTATNHAGASAQTSAPRSVGPAPPPAGGGPAPPEAGVITLGALKRDAARGTARLTVTVSAPGTVRLTGKGVRGAEERADAGGTVRLAIKPRGSVARKLDRRGKTRVRVSVTFTPNAGATAEVSRSVKLRKRQR